MTSEKFANRLKSLRERDFQLTQAQFATLVGMGVATINRYENGTEPTEAHRRFLEGLSNPDLLLSVLQGKTEAVGHANVLRLSKFAETAIGKKDLGRVEACQKNISNRELTGMREFNLSRLIEMVRFFTAEGEWKTKLNKLLFYADFFAYRELGKSISGTRYVIGTFGPIPEGQELLYSSLEQAKVIQRREKFTRETGEPVEKLYSTNQVSRRIFSLKELKILESVQAFFSKMSARDIAEYSHEEDVYDEKLMGESIPYTKAKTLRPITLAPTSESPKSFADIARDIASTIPEEELANVPADASLNLDHYLYGGPKRKK